MYAAPAGHPQTAHYNNASITVQITVHAKTGSVYVILYMKAQIAQSKHVRKVALTTVLAIMVNATVNQDLRVSFVNRNLA